jgi:hypothetical protein
MRIAPLHVKHTRTDSDADAVRVEVHVGLLVVDLANLRLAEAALGLRLHRAVLGELPYALDQHVKLQCFDGAICE